MSSVATCWVGGFIGLALSGRRITCADKPDAAVALSVRHDKQPTTTRQADAQKPSLVDRMAGIADRQLQRITENGHRLAEFDAVLGRVFGRLRGIPFELHDVSLASSLLGEVRPNACRSPAARASQG